MFVVRRFVFLVVAFDDGVQRLVDAGSFVLQRFGVRLSAQLAACHLSMAALVSAMASDEVRSGELTLGLILVGGAFFWFVMAAATYWLERRREELTVNLPRGRSWVVRAFAWWLMARAIVRVPEEGFGERCISALLLTLIVYLTSTANRPPPAARRRSALVPASAIGEAR
jgi:hypothetical protein